MIDDGTIVEARLGLGGVGTIPWRAREAERVLTGAPANADTFRAAAEAAIADPFTVAGTAFKVELAKRTIVRILRTVSGAASMTEVASATIVGTGVDRVDGPLKVAGAAPYPSDVSYPGMAYAALVRSTIAAGRITSIDTSAAEAAPACWPSSPTATPRSSRVGPMTVLGPTPPPPLQDDRILHYGQYVAVVVADTPQQAAAAARLVDVGYAPTEAVLDIDDSRGELRTNPWGTDAQRGDVDAALAVRRRHARGDLHDAGQHEQPARPVRDGGGLGRRHGHGARRDAVDEEHPGDDRRGIRDSRGGGPGPGAVRRRRLRLRAAGLAARDPDGSRRAYGAAAGQGGAHPAADVHRRRSPAQHGADDQDRRQTRRRAGRDRPRIHPDGRHGGRQRRVGRDNQCQRVRLPERLHPTICSGG